MQSGWNISMKCVVLCLLFSFNVVAQSPESEVHVAPLKKPPAAISNGSNTQTADAPHDDLALKTHEKPIKVDVDLVLVNVTVTDSMNRLVTGLEKENFALTEVNIAQEIKHFASEDAPISLGVIFDISGSMSNKIDKSKLAVVEFFKTANIKDEFFVITFSDKPQLLADFTSSIEDVQGKLAFTVPRGRTALL